MVYLRKYLEALTAIARFGLQTHGQTYDIVVLYHMFTSNVFSAVPADFLFLLCRTLYAITSMKNVKEKSIDIVVHAVLVSVC